MAKIALCIPHNYPVFDKAFTLSLLSVIASFYEWNQTLKEKHEFVILHNKDGWIDRMRELLAQEAVEVRKVDFLLWLDTDMQFPPSIVQQMMAWMEKFPELDGVTGLYTWKVPPFMPHVYSRYDEKDDKFTVAGGFPLNAGFSVEGAGFGCVMLRSSLFERTPRPWFKFEYGVYGEDLYFFRKARPVNMICDPRISCTHLLTGQGVDIKSYLKYNKLQVVDEIDENKQPYKNIKIDQATLNRISDLQIKLTQNFEKSKLPS